MGLSLVGLASLLLIGARAFWAARSRTGPRASERGDWASIVVLTADQSSAEAVRLRARGLAGLGRATEAIALQSTIGAALLDADDFFQDGQALTKAGRIAPAWMALEAASRLNALHRPTIAVRAELHPRLEESGETGAASISSDAVPDALALAEWVLGVLAISEREKPLASLDDLLDRDRAAFLGLDSPGAARKLIVRALLEKGATTEALAWLDKVTDGTNDREVSWLRSRADLVRGDAETAGAEADRAGRFGLDAPLAKEPGRYVGAKRCAGCHAEIYQSQQSSRHAMSVARGDALASVPVPDRPVADPDRLDVVHTIERRDGRIDATARVDGALFAAWLSTRWARAGTG